MLRDGQYCIMSQPKLKVLDGEFSIYRFRPAEAIPAAVLAAACYSIARTDEELSIVCDDAVKLRGGEKSPGWACVEVSGPIDFSEIGILAGISAALAAAEISIFAVSTYNTDYILLPAVQLEKAKAASRPRIRPVRSPIQPAGDLNPCACRLLSVSGPADA